MDGSVLVGVPADDDGTTDSGSGLLFDVSSGDHLATIRNPSAVFGERFGSALAADGNMVLIGAPLVDPDNANFGAVYVYEVVPEPSTWLLATLGIIGMGLRRRPK